MSARDRLAAALADRYRIELLSDAIALRSALHTIVVESQAPR